MGKRKKKTGLKKKAGENIPEIKKKGHMLQIDSVYAASRPDYILIIENLVGDYPNVKTTTDPDYSSLPKDINVEELIEVLQAVGAACIFHGDRGVREYGLACWKESILLREAFCIPKETLHQSKWEKLALRNKVEFQTVEELSSLLRQRRTHWIVQTYFLGRRTLEKRNCFPTGCIVFNMFNFALSVWIDCFSQSEPTNQSRCFALNIFLVELFSKNNFWEHLILNPSERSDVVHRTFLELFNTLGDPVWTQLDLAKPDPVLTFDHLIDTLNFCFLYQVKVHDKAPKEEIKIINERTIQSKDQKLEDISELILLILKLLVSIPKSKSESKRLKIQLEVYINIFELKRVPHKPNLLLRVCTSHQGTPNEFKLIKLLLKAGADPNAVDQQRCSPLHLLAKSEHLSSRMWDDPLYSTRAENFISTVRLILHERFHDEQVNLSGQSALECIQNLLSRYPDAELSRLVVNFSQSVRPLSCIAAKEVRRNQLPCEGLPLTVQSMVLQH